MSLLAYRALGPVLVGLRRRLKDEIPEKRRPAVDIVVRVLWALADAHRVEREYIDETVEQLVAATGLGRSSVLASMQALDALGLTVVVNPGGRNRAPGRSLRFLPDSCGGFPTRIQAERCGGCPAPSHAEACGGIDRKVRGDSPKGVGDAPHLPSNPPEDSPRGGPRRYPPQGKPSGHLRTATQRAAPYPHHDTSEHRSSPWCTCDGNPLVECDTDSPGITPRSTPLTA